MRRSHGRSAEIAIRGARQRGEDVNPRRDEMHRRRSEVREGRQGIGVGGGRHGNQVRGIEGGRVTRRGVHILSAVAGGGHEKHIVRIGPVNLIQERLGKPSAAPTVR